MGIRSDERREPYDASDRKTFHSALCRLLHTEFPGVFGPLITNLFADKIGELYDRFHPPGSRFKVGQVLWAAVAIDDPPSHNKRIEDTKLLPVVLDLVTAQDIQETAAKGQRGQTRRNKIVHLCRQAHAQKAVLSLADVSLLLHVHISYISSDHLMFYNCDGFDTVVSRDSGGRRSLSGVQEHLGLQADFRLQCP